jgi:hypothetical protein
MPMRNELYVPARQPHHLARSSTWRRIIDDPDFNIIIVFLLLGASLAIFMTTHYSLPEDLWTAVMTMT